MKKINKKRLIAVTAFTLSYLFAVLVLHRFGIDCIFRTFFGISCPGCGMTHAFIALLRLDLASAFRYHPMIFFVPVIFLYLLTDGHVFKSKFANTGVISLIFLGFIVNYIIKLIYC